MLGVPGGCRAVYWNDGSTWFRELAPAERPQKVTLHIVPFSHLDPGWISTVQDMYNGTFSPCVRDLISSVVQALADDPTGRRTFAPEHAAFHQLWWRDATEGQRAAVRRLVAEGRLEWAGGGWVQPDEAASRFENQIDQATLGHLWLHGNLGVERVAAAWQADPFGRSTTAAHIFSRQALDGFVFGRGMSRGDPINEQTGVLWDTLAAAGSGAGGALLTLEQRSGYWNPLRDMHGALMARNTTAAQGILSACIDRQLATASPPASNLLLMLGDDLAWHDARDLYPAVDDLIAAVNAAEAATGVSARYSTPSQFLRALLAEGLAFPVRPPEWDMLPLIGGEMAAPWTGFFTSRPAFKRLVRSASGLWRAAQQLHALARDGRRWAAQFAELAVLWEAISLAQHHDAITGDGFAVANADFTRRLVDGMARAAGVAAEAAGVLLGAGTGLQACLNASEVPCPGVAEELMANGSVSLAVYNPQAWPRDEFVELLLPPAVAARGAVVTSGAGAKPVACQLAPQRGLPGQEGADWVSLVFNASDLPPMGFRQFTLKVGSTSLDDIACSQAEPRPLLAGGESISNRLVTLKFDKHGDLQAISRDTGTVRFALAVRASVLAYSSRNGTENAWDFTTNGAAAASAQPFGDPGAQQATVLAGPLYQEVLTVVDAEQGVSLRFRLFAGESHCHLLVSSGPFRAVSRGMNQDAILRLDTNISSDRAWLTDSNGLAFMPRVRNERPWQAGNWTAPGEPVASNYYPVTMAAILPTAGSAGGPAMAVLTSASQGAASLADGSLELMVNRAVLQGSAADPASCDNSTGNGLVALHHILAVFQGTASDAAAGVRRPAATLANTPVLFAAGGGAGAGLGPSSLPDVRHFVQELPPQVELLTLLVLPPGKNVSFVPPSAAPVPVDRSVLLLRLRHIYAADERGPDGSLAHPVAVDLSTLFLPRWRVVRATETTIDGWHPLADAEERRLKWRRRGQENDDGAAGHKEQTSISGGGLQVVLHPMDIRTWELTIGAVEFLA